jgi:AraC family ethanolamine operon transcriptional activator
MDNKNMARIESSHQLREYTRGSDVDIVQLKAGRQHGFLAHIDIDSLAMTIGRFALDVRVRGLINPNRVTLGMMLASPGRVSHWWEDVRPGDVVIFPPGAEIDARSVVRLMVETPPEENEDAARPRSPSFSSRSATKSKTVELRMQEGDPYLHNRDIEIALRSLNFEQDSAVS